MSFVGVSAVRLRGLRSGWVTVRRRSGTRERVPLTGREVDELLDKVGSRIFVLP
jgi:hypothetical protein